MNKDEQFREHVKGFLSSKKEGNSNGVLFHLSKLIELEPENPEHYYNRGVAQGHLENYELAISNYTKAIKLNPNNFEAWGNRGVAYDALGQRDKAISDLEKCLQINPHSIHQINLKNIKEKYGKRQKKF